MLYVDYQSMKSTNAILDIPSRITCVYVYVCVCMCVCVYV